MKILFLVPYPLKESPSQRFRFEQYFEILARRGYQYRVQSFLESHNWQLFFKKGNQLRKMAALLKGFTKRFYMLFFAPFYAYVFIHREASPIGPPLFEWILAKVFRTKIIYDFDDAIWLTDRPNEPFLLRFLKWRKKVAAICRWSYRVSCGNHYLCQFALRHNANVVLNPTTIDTDNVHNPEGYKKMKSNELVIGWTGSHSTLKYLKEIQGVLQQIEQQFPTIRWHVIADRPPDLQLKNLHFIPWNINSEMSDLGAIDIGIMPLPDDEWSKGKCGFKALQYMAMEIPTVASPVGVNRIIVNDGVNGYLASSSTEWNEKLTQLIVNENIRVALGTQGRATVERHYSVRSNSETFLSLFDNQRINIRLMI